MPEHPVTFGDAKYGATVALADGRIGILVFVARNSRRCKVLVDGRHIRVDASDIVGVVSRGDELGHAQ